MHPTIRADMVLVALLFVVGAVGAGLLIWQRVKSGGMKAGTQETGMRWQAGIGPETDDERSHLELRITAVHKLQRPTDQAPWHQPGGQWTFLECTTVSAPSVSFLVGVSSDASGGGSPVAWGQAILAVQDREQGAQVVNAFAHAFHGAVPTPRPGQPAGSLKLRTAMFGENMSRDPAGGFTGKRGEWTATKWFLENEEAGEAEVFFNFSVATRQAEFSEKDEDYRDSLVAGIATSLRDGPLPQRTPKNDPTLTLAGPKIVDWQRVAGKTATVSFGGDGTSLLVVEREKGASGSTLLLVPIAEPAQPRVVARFEGPRLETIFVHQNPSYLVGEESSPREARAWSPDDPRRLWLIHLPDGDRRQLAKELENEKQLSLAARETSPDGHFLALQIWRNIPQGKPPRRTAIIFLELNTGALHEEGSPSQSWSFIRWEHAVPGAVAVLREGLSFEKAAHPPRWFDAASRKFTDPPAGAPSIPPDVLVSPDGAQSVLIAGAESKGEERLIFTDLKTNAQREFHFGERDRHHVFEGCVQWAGRRYLSFDGARPALIDSRDLKISFSVDPERRFQSIEYSPDFRYAIGTNDEGCFIGRIDTGEN